MHCVDLGESFQTHIFLQIVASIPPRTSPVKFARSLAMQQPASAAVVGSADRRGAGRPERRQPRATRRGRGRAVLRQPAGAAGHRRPARPTRARNESKSIISKTIRLSVYEKPHVLVAWKMGLYTPFAQFQRLYKKRVISLRNGFATHF